MKRKGNKIKTIFFMLLTICMMTVLLHDSVFAANVKLNRTQVQIVRGDTRRLYVKGSRAKVRWYSSNAKIATVSNGKVTAKKKGTAVIYAKVNGKKYACKVTVVTQQRAYIDTLQKQINIQRRRFYSRQLRSARKSWQRNSPMQGRMATIGLLQSVCVIILKRHPS